MSNKIQNSNAERGGATASADQLKEKAGDVKQNLQDMGTLARDAATEKAAELRDKASEWRDTAQQKVGEMRDTAQQRVSEMRDTAQQKAGELRDTAQQKVGELSDSAAEYYDYGKQRANELERGLEQRIREKPLNSVIIAAGIGMLVGIVWMRR